MAFYQNQLQSFSLAGAGVVAGATTMTLKSMLDIDGNALTMATAFGAEGWGTVEPGNNTLEESISFTGLTNNSNGTVTLTGIKSVTFGTPYTQTSGFAKTHAGSTTFVISNTSGYYTEFTKKSNDETVTGYWAVPSPLANANPATKQYVDNLVSGGSVTNTAIVVTGTAGETVAAGQILYLKAADGRWWKATSAAAATTDLLQLGIAQGAGTAGNTITGGILIRGIDTNQTGLTAGVIYYLSTGGAISSSAGTVERAIGQGADTTKLYFDPVYFYVPTATQKAALPGMSGTLSSTNKYETGVSAQNLTSTFAADAGSTDDYAITVTPVPAAYATGQRFVFTANSINTGSASLNVNSLGAKNITKFKNVNLEAGDIKAGQVVETVYDGTQFQAESALGSISKMFASSAVSTSTNAETNLFSVTVPANLLSTSNGVRARMYVTGNGGGGGHGGGGTFTVKVKYGATTMITSTDITTDSTLGPIDVILLSAGTTASQKALLFIDLSTEATGTGLTQTRSTTAGTATEDSTADKTFACTAQWQNAGSTFTVSQVIVERII